MAEYTLPVTSGPAEVRELASALLDCADRALLDRPLDALALSLADHAARDVLLDAHASGEFDNLRDLLTGDALACHLERSATASEVQALAAQLSAWLGLTDAGPDDPARLARATAPPSELEALLRWARPYGLLEQLVRPLHELLPLLPGETAPPALSLVACCLDAFEDEGREHSVAARAAWVARARSHLHALASARAAETAREALWQTRLAAGPLATLRARLSGLVAPGELGELARLRFVPAWPVAVDAATGVCRARLREAADQPPLACQLLLSGYEQRAPHAECACARPRCGHVRALAARLIDACCDPKDALHEVLARFTERPSWQRFLDSLEPAKAEPASEPARLGFRVQLAAGRARVAAVSQRRLADGRHSEGKLGSPAALLRSSACTERDRPVLEAMRAQSRALGAQRVLADLTLLRALADHPHVWLDADGEQRARPLALREQNLSLELLEQPEGLLPRLSLAGTQLSSDAAPRDASYVLSLDRERGVLRFAPLSPALRRLLRALEHFRGVLPPESYAHLTPWLASLRSVAEVALPEVLRARERPAPRQLLLRITPRPDEGLELGLTLRGLPLGALFSPGLGPELVHGLERGVAVSLRRDLAWERDTAAGVIDALELARCPQTADGAYLIDTTQAALAVLARAARLHEQLELEWAEPARRLAICARVQASDLHVRLFQKGDWLTLAGGVEHPEAQIAVERLLEAVRRGERFVRVRGGDYAEIERELFERLERAQLCVVTPLRAARSAAGEPPPPELARAALPFWLAQLGDRTEAGDALAARWRQALERPAATAADLPASWRAQLREYQREGVAWLQARSAWAPGACLADEMGLGKTVQAIALLEARAALGPALVIAPTSVVANWSAELARFAPSLRVIVYRGAHRRARLIARSSGAASSLLGPRTVVLTSYETVLRDRDQLAQQRFATQVVDEAQTLRNARTRRARAVAEIPAEFRLALSGTPVENRLGDLWSLFQLIAPGLLGSWARFRALFAVPIERYGDAERAALLRELIAPFLLRRTKREVAQELPARTEVVHMIEPSPAERALYHGALRRVRRTLDRRPGDPELPPIQVLAELTRLRQLACHPRLVLQDERAESSKLASLMQLLSDILPRGHRALVFSQFTQHLALVREALEAAGVRYLYLDGSTPATQRGALVERFQTGDEPAFLISLKAGGTGLNLTQADYVVHMDPWWNPAAEDQASDRAHRIGQTRPLTIVKLVARGTIEEKVLGLHGHKRRLADAVFAGGGGTGLLDRSTLEALLSS